MQEQKPKKKRLWVRWVAVAAAIVFVIFGASYVNDLNLGAEKKSVRVASEEAPAETHTVYADGDSVAESGYAASAMRSAGTGSAAANDSLDTQEAKIIKTASLTIKTQSFDEDLAQLKEAAAALGGRVESSGVSGDRQQGAVRTAYLTLRLPAEQLDAFLNGTGSLKGRVTASSEDSQDVSDSYYDLEARLNTQKTKLARLQELMAQATDVADLIEIESAISDAQYYIDSYTGRLKQYDSQVSYSTVSITLREETVREAAQEAPSFGTRLVSGLSASLQEAWIFLQNAAIFLVMAAPWLAVIAAVIVVIRIVHKNRKKKEK